MAGRRRSKVVVEDVVDLLSSSDEEAAKDGVVRQRTLSISHSGRFKEQKRRGVLSESVFSKPAEAQQDENENISSKDKKRGDSSRIEANTKFPAAAQKEQGVEEKMTVVFETKL